LRVELRGVVSVYLRLSETEKQQIWEQLRSGVSYRTIALKLGRSSATVRDYVAVTGGVRPAVRARRAGCLSAREREEISRGIAAGQSLRRIAGDLGRWPSTVSREVNRNGGRCAYRAAQAEEAAWARACRPKVCRLAANRQLRALVAGKLALDWSPQQVAGWLRRAFPDDAEMWVSHETIYLSLFVQARGVLAKQLTAHLRTGRVTRRPRAHSAHGHGRGQIVGAVAISERPPEADDRAVPGHWEGDLLVGGGHSQIATLVERQTRFLMLVRLPGGRGTEHVVDQLGVHIRTLPTQLRRSLTWDHGKEMAEHVRFSVDTGVAVYFCDPRSPWQRGTNENTNGLLRQYFPKRAGLAGYSQEDLDSIAERLNGRPRQTLDWLSPSEKLAEALR
jgi:IS30 family transposase